MAYLRPWIFLDTGVCIELAKEKGSVPVQEWEFVRRYIRRRYRYCISRVTLSELLLGIARGDEAHLEQNKNRLRMLSISGNVCFLDLPALFAIKTAFGIDATPATEQDGSPRLPHAKWSRGVLSLVLSARTKAELNGAEFPNLAAYFSLDDFEKDQKRLRQENASLLEGIRQQKIEPGDSKSLAARILHDLDLTPYVKPSEQLAERLDAACRYTFWLCNQAKVQNYDFHQHLSDWNDVMQLFYLSEPRIHLVTMDRNFLDRTQGSRQRHQVLLYEDLRNAAAVSSGLLARRPRGG